MKYHNMGELADYRAAASPDEVFLAFYGRYVTYREFNERANRFANALVKLGVKKGDVVNVHLFNCPEHFIICMAAFKIGAVANPVNPQFTRDELIYQVNDSGGVVLVTENRLSEVCASARDKLSTVRHVVEMGETTRDGNLSLEDLVAQEGVELPSQSVGPDDNMIILYTSGTTGKPKGALLTHGNFIYMIGAVGKILDMVGVRKGARCVRLIFMPMFHVNPLIHNLLALDRGDKNVLLRKFSVREFGPTVQEERPDYFFGVPKVFKVLLEAKDTIKEYDLSSLVLAGCGAAPMPPETIVEFEKEYGIEILEGYGLTEATFASTLHRPGEKKKIGSIGPAIYGQDVRIMDANGNFPGQGEVGEIVIGGPAVMKAYYRKDKETGEIIKDGWLHTGDIGRMDEDGFFFILDRNKDMIIKGGENIYPKEIEDVISKVPGVHDVAVIGVPDKMSGEEVKAFVVPKIGSSPSSEDIIGHCKKYLTDYKVPMYVEFVLGIPSSAVGKALKRQLRDGEGVVSMNQEVDPIPLEHVWKAIAGRFKPQKAGSFKAKIAYEIFGKTSGTATFEIEDGRITINEKKSPDANAVIKMTDIALTQVIQGKLDFLTGMNSGLIQVEGNEADVALFGEALG